MKIKGWGFATPQSQADWNSYDTHIFTFTLCRTRKRARELSKIIPQKHKIAKVSIIIEEK